MSPAFTFAWKMFLHDKIKAAAAILGIGFSALLSLIQTGMYLGYMHNASSVIDHSTADLWVMREGTDNFDVAQPMGEKVYHQVWSVPGVARVERMILGMSYWRTPRGGLEGPEILGLETNAQLLRPWNIVEGSFQVLENERSIILDKLEMKKLGISGLGHRTELWDERAVVRGFTQGVRSFITAPVIFASLKDARRYGRIPDDQVVYLLVKLDPRADAQAVKKAIEEKVPFVDVHTRKEFSQKTRHYWSRTTGVGVALFTSAFLGILVGIAVVALTLYMSISDHIKEYGTLKAVGVSNKKIMALIGYQSILLALLGSATGLAGAMVAMQCIAAVGITVILPVKTVAGLLSLIVVLCYLSSFLSVQKVLNLEPAMVFQR